MREAALKYMENQVRKHRNTLDREIMRKAPDETISNLIMKIRYYVEAVEALRGPKDVVRCKDCSKEWCYLRCELGKNGFCSAGERKKENDRLQ